MLPSDVSLEADADVGNVERLITTLKALSVVNFLFPIRGARPGVQAQLWCSAAHTDPRKAKEQAQTTKERTVTGCTRTHTRQGSANVMMRR